MVVAPSNILIVPHACFSAIAGFVDLNGENNVFTQISLIVLVRGWPARTRFLTSEFAREKQPQELAVNRVTMAGAGGT